MQARPRMSVIVCIVASLFCFAASAVGADPKPASSIPSSVLIQPAELAAALAGDAKKPLLLSVGFRNLFEQAHIPGAEYIGAGRDSGALAKLRDRVSQLPKDAAIVLYCGCCPWNRCPNIAAAYDVLHELGFTNLKVLYIGQSFGEDWVDKGYPASSGA